MTTSIRSISGPVDVGRIQDPEVRRALQAILFRQQWIIDNWPATTKAKNYTYSVKDFNGDVHLVGDEVPHKDKRYYGTDAWGVLGFHRIPEDVVHRMSVSNKSDVVTLLNDEQDPDYGQGYGVDIDGDKGWIYPREHPFRFQQTSDTGGDITAGTVMFEGSILTITGLPPSLSDVKTTTCYYITLDIDGGTASWGSAANDFPAGTTTATVYRILKLICTDDIITGIEQHRWSDISVDTPSGAPDDPVDPGEYVTTIDDTAVADIAKTWQVGDVDGFGVRLGLEHTKHTVPVYSETDHKWYSYTRVLTYAIDGRLFKMSAATKQTVHEPINHALL
jgi:hypothetical protein